jgi:uncharacterized damage-inducible protein DinB
MTILDRLLGHDTWTTRQLLLRCRELSEEQMNRTFDIGDRSLRETFEHLIACMESHTDLMMERTMMDDARDDDSLDGMLQRLTIVAKDFTEFAARIDRENRADDMCISTKKEGKWPLGSLIAHLLTHSERHRAQILYMLECLGVQNVIEADALGWEGQARGWGYDWCNSYGKVIAE